MSALSGMGTRRAYSLGSLFMYLYPVTNGTDTSTHATALNYVKGEWMHRTDDTTGLVKKGVDVGEASGALTVNLGEDAATGSLYVITPEIE